MIRHCSKSSGNIDNFLKLRICNFWNKIIFFQHVISPLYGNDRKQDDEYMMRRKSLILDAKKSTCKNQMVKPRVTARQSYSSTLFNTTEVWRERCKIEESETKESKRLQYIKDVPRLYVVSE